jgi:hypothetical protein
MAPRRCALPWRLAGGAVSVIRFGEELEAVLRNLPRAGALFPKLRLMREAHRATEFHRVCRRVSIVGISLFATLSIANSTDAVTRLRAI